MASYIDSIWKEVQQKATELRGDGHSDNTDVLSYETLLADRTKYRQAGGVNSSDFNIYDTPGRNYFRLLFHFFETPEDDSTGGVGLLHPTWLDVNEDENLWTSQEKHSSRAQELIWWRYNTAYAYLKENAEDTRATYLKSFIQLLSNINSQSPWYFQKIKGLDEALNRKQINDEWTFKERYKISIECLDDSVDDRIGTMLDLYRAAVWSWRTKREIVPSNLRKFDMTIVEMGMPIQAMHTPVKQPKLTDALGKVAKWIQPDDEPDYATTNINELNNKPVASFKRFELHNCEIDINSSKSGYGDGLDNIEGGKHTYTIDIWFDDIMEDRYNALSLDHPTDIVKSDTPNVIYDFKPSNDNANIYTEYSSAKANISEKNDDYMGTRLNRRNGRNIKDQIIGGLVGKVSSKVDSIILGNLSGFSIDRIGKHIDEFMERKVWTTVGNVKREVSGSFNGSLTAKEPYKNINTDSQKIEIIKKLGNIFTQQNIGRSQL